MDQLFALLVEDQNKQEVQRIIACNQKTEQFGLILSNEDAKELAIMRQETLKENQRIEFGEGIITKLIEQFCDSSYINQDNYKETLSQLQEIFYLFKNESQDEMTDDELLTFMQRQFDDICFGDLEYLSTTCLERFTRAVRAGYLSEKNSRLRDEYSLSGDENEYDNFSEETRWELDMFLKVFNDLID